jgi:hypothetical protein
MRVANSSPIEVYLADRLTEAMARAGFSMPAGARVEIEVPREEGHGDWASAAALVLAKSARRPPRDVATSIAATFECDPAVLDRVEIAGPGFLNFHLSAAWLHGTLRRILADPDTFGAIVCSFTFSSASSARITSSSGGVCGASVSSIDTSAMKLFLPFSCAMCR